MRLRLLGLAAGWRNLGDRLGIKYLLGTLAGHRARQFHGLVYEPINLRRPAKIHFFAGGLIGDHVVSVACALGQAACVAGFGSIGRLLFLLLVLLW